MLLPLLILLSAGISAAVVAYGTQPNWAQFQHGLDLILWSRRLQWPLIALSILCCLLLIGLIISGRKRAWWLIGLAPILALFFHRFGPRQTALRPIAMDNPPFVAASAAGMGDDEWVVGVVVGDQAYAFPYREIFRAPLILKSDHDKRIAMIWSAYANRILVLPITHEFKASDWEIVGTPANALLMYNTRYWQFMDGVTGQTPAHERPHGVAPGLPLPAEKTTWGTWVAEHPDTQVLAVPRGSRDFRGEGPLNSAGASGVAPASAPSGGGASVPDSMPWDMPALSPAPTVPIAPQWTPPLKPISPAPAPTSMPASQPTSTSVATGLVETNVNPQTPLALIGYLAPLAIDPDTITSIPFNTQADQIPIVLFRDGVDGPIHAMSRQIANLAGRDPYIAHFVPSPHRKKKPTAVLYDEGTNTDWTADGVCLEATPEMPWLKNKRLDLVGLDTGLSLAVLRYWYPQLTVVAPPPPPTIVDEPSVKHSTGKTASHRRKRRKSATPAS